MEVSNKKLYYQILYFLVIGLIYPRLGKASSFSPPKIVNQPGTDVIIYEVNKTAFIPCSIQEGSQIELIRWEKNGKNVSLSDGKICLQTADDIAKYGKSTTGLIIEKTTHEDEGFYQCFASNYNGTSMSNVMFLTNITLGNCEKKQAHIGDWFQLTINKPKGLVGKYDFWKYQSDDARIVESDERIYDDEGNLWFLPFDQPDGRKYAYAHANYDRNSSECDVEIIYNRDEKSKDTNKFIWLHGSNKNENAIWGESKKLFCLFSGNTADYQTMWTKNDVKLNTTNSAKIKLGKSSKYIEIMKFSKEDEGNYVCRILDASNKAVLKYNATFNVKIGKPYFEHELENKEVIEGNRINLDCNVSSSGHDANSKLTIQWFHNGKRIEQPQRQDNDRCLIIKNSSNLDSGVYGCNASNTFGYVYKELNLRVQEAVSPHVNELQNNNNTHSNISKGGSKNFVCKLEAFPTPEIKWTKNNTELKNSSHVMISNDGTMLTISNFTSDYAGVYNCFARNVKGSEHLYFSLDEIEVPAYHELESSSTDWWLIFPLIILALVIAVIVIYRKHIPDGIYYVVGEKKDGRNDPETCLQQVPS